MSVAAMLVAIASDLHAQAPNAGTTPSFTLSTSHMFTTRERPAVWLTFQHVQHLDFRLYKVKDVGRFFEQLKDPHNLGGFKPEVPQEPTILERIARWKAARRYDVRRFVRRQLSFEYRLARREREDKQKVVLRRTVNVNNFAQVPVLNASQLVTSWRELLPAVRDVEYRRIPLEIAVPGIYVVEAIDAPLEAYTIVVVSDAAIVTKTAPGELLVFAANRFNGDPLQGCRVHVLLDQKSVSTGETAADGTFHVDLTVGRPDHLVTLAQCGEHTAATDPGVYSIREPPRELTAYIYTDRPVYRPGHLVHYKAVLRWREKSALMTVGRDQVEVTIRDMRNKVVLRDRRPVDEFGSLNGSFTIPAVASLGTYTVRAAIGDYSASGSFDVQEYRKPEFDVAVRPSVKRELQGRTVTATISARYYFGQPVARGSVKYAISRQAYYSAIRGDDAEGEGTEGFGGERDGEDQTLGDSRQIEGTATLNEQGLAEIPVQMAVDGYGRDYALHIEARVADASGREVTGSGQVVATYGSFMVIARTERFVYGAASTANVDLRAVDYDGNARAGVRMHVVLQQVDYSRRSSAEKIADIQSADVDAGTDGRASWPASIPNRSGYYRVRVTAPSEGREVSDVIALYVPGARAEEREFDGDYRYLELVADQRSYRPNDTAHLVVRGADFDSFVLVTKESQRVSYHRVVRANNKQAIDVPIGHDDIGDTYVSIAFLKDDRLYRAERRLSVPATERQLTVTATPDRDVSRPGDPGLFTLHVVDASGAAVRAQLSVGLVDEALYGVAKDTTPDPLRFFYRREYDHVATSFSRDYPFVGYSGTQQLLLARRHHPMTLADFKADRPDRPRIRKDFPDTAFWAGDVVTNAEGNAQIHVSYPDSLTTWRLTARAVTVSTDVGATVAHTLTTKDLILRVVPPRFLTEGDQVSVPAIVHNYLPDGKAVSLSMTAEGLSADGGPASPRAMQVPSNGQQRSDWRYKADQVRRVTLTGKAITDTASDAMELSLPVLPAGLQRNTGSSGSILDVEPHAIDLMVPQTANVSGRSVRVALMPSLAGSMLGALDYLTSYPWGCTEQTVSSFVPNLVVLRAMTQMKIAPTERIQSLDRRIDDGLKRLYDFQHADGGWGWWKTDENQPFMTAYALDGLLQARENQVAVGGYQITIGTQALQALYAKYPRAIPDLKAYETYVLARANASTFKLTDALNDLWAARSRMTTSGRAYLLMTLDAAKDVRGNDLAREILGDVKTRGDLAWWVVETDPFLEDFFDTTPEGSALALKALAARDPRNPLLERVARWLVLNRSAGGYWSSTKQTALAVQGLLAYMQARGEQPAPFTADVFVNGARVASQSFDAASLVAPNPVLVESPAVAGANTVRIVKRGGGVLYYDASVRYYDKPAAAERTGSRRLAMTRTYATLSPARDKNGAIVYRQGAFGGTAKPGDLLLVRLTAAGSSDWKYLMVEDPIPAGTEAVEQPESLQIENVSSWWFGSQREFRDDRTVYFVTALFQGRFEAVYLLKVTTPGTFAAMPARISPMYVPDVSASSDVISLTVPAEGAP